MWSNKKPDTPKAADSQPTNLQTTQPTKVTPAFWQRTTMMNNNVIRPTGATADRVMARLGSSLHVKGEIAGNEDLYIDGTVEGLIQLDERKLTVGATAKLTADIIASEVIVYGSVKGNIHGKGKIEIKKDGSPGNWGCFIPDNYRQYSASIGGWFPLEQRLSTSRDHRLRRPPTLSHS